MAAPLLDDLGAEMEADIEEVQRARLGIKEWFAERQRTNDVDALLERVIRSSNRIAQRHG